MTTWYSCRDTMVDVLFWLYVVALLSGSASISVTLLVYSQQRKPVELYFAVFLASLFLITLSMAIGNYAIVVPHAKRIGAHYASLASMVAGATGFVAVAPFFYDAVTGHRPPAWRRGVYLGVTTTFLLLAISVFFWPTFPPTLFALNVLLFGMIAFGIVEITVRYRHFGDPTLKRATRVFLVVSVLFFPLLLLDSMLGRLPQNPITAALDGSALPLYFLVVNSLAIAFAINYLNEPAFLERGVLSQHFRDRFGISERESEIVAMLIDGRTSREAADALSISVKTVENHVYNIYQKTHVRNRVELVNLIQEHRGAK